MPEEKKKGVPKKIVLRKHTDCTIDSEATLNLGRTFAGRIDNFFGNLIIKAGETEIDGRKVRAIATSKEKNSVDMLIGDTVLTLQLNINPLADTVNSIFADILWANAGVISDYASQDDVQGNRHYALKDVLPISISLVPKETGNIYDVYESAHDDVRNFIMKRLGNEEMSWEESEGNRAFPKEIDETWLRNRFLQTSAFLGEVFAFPDDLTREVFLSAFLTKGGSCLLSGIPGTGKTKLTDLATVLLFNAYGYAGYEYKSPVQDRIKKKIPKYIYSDLSGLREEEKNINILTVPPTSEQMKGRQWTILENIPTTIETEIVSFEPNGDQMSAFIETMKKKYPDHDIKGDIEALKSSIDTKDKIWIGGYKGPKNSQKFSINRLGTYARRWNDERFDQNLLKGKAGSEGGILMNEYYTKSLLRKVTLNDGSSFYVTDVAYDVARYPDSGERVDWEKEMKEERYYLEFELQLAEPGGLKEQVSKATTPEDKAKIQAEIDNIMALQSHIHKMRNLPEGKWRDPDDGFNTGERGKVPDDELQKIHRIYSELYNLLQMLINAVPGSRPPVFEARSYDDITDEMKQDMGLTTCSENKSPEDILYMTEISMVQDTDDVGRTVSQYIFKPSPQEFVTKPGKFLNEFTRADKDFQDQLLSLLDRRMVEYRGEQFKSPEFVLFCDNNPHKLLTSEIDWALWDRIDIEIFLKGATLGTKDMVLNRKFGREDRLIGRTKMKMSMESELLTRIQKAAFDLNDFEASRIFRDRGIIKKEEGTVQGVIPMRIRELMKIWEYVEKVTIPKDVLRYTFLLTSTLNQAWYLRKTVVNPTGVAQAQTIQFTAPDRQQTNLVPNDFQPYGNTTQDKGGTMPYRETILDYSMLSFAEMFESKSVTISGGGPDQAEEEFPLGVVRPCGIRYVISLLKFAKSLAWYRRGQTEVTIKEINDLFPKCGSHRLNVMPFGEEHMPGIAPSMMELYPNIQDFLEYGVLKAFWGDEGGTSPSKKAKRYLDYYSDLASVIDAGFLDIDHCAPPELDQAAGGLCKIQGCHSHADLADWQNDVLILDIMNGVEFAKRNSPDYKRHYLKRLDQIMVIAAGNYYERFISNAKTYIKDYDLNEVTGEEGKYNVPMKLFPKDAKEFAERLDGLSTIFTDENLHQITLSQDMLDVGIIVLERYAGIADGYDAKMSPVDAKVIKDKRDELVEVKELYELAYNINKPDDIKMYNAEIVARFNKIKNADPSTKSSPDYTPDQIEAMPVDDVISFIEHYLNEKVNIDAFVELNPSEYMIAGKPLFGTFNVKFTSGGTDASGNVVPQQRFVRLTPSTMNEHLYWRYVRYNEQLSKRPTLTDEQKLSG